MPRVSIAVVLSLILAAPACAQDGRLQQVREQVRTPSDSSDSSKPPGGSSNDDDCGWGELVGDMVGGAAVHVIAFPFVGPAWVLGDDWDRRMYLPRYPYPCEYPGYLLHSANDAFALHETSSEGVRRRDWAGRLSLENGNDFSGLNRLAGSLRLDTAYRIGLVTTWNWLADDLSHRRRDDLLLGDVNLIVRFAQNETASFYAGAGIRTLSDRWCTDWGLNAIYGVDWFPVRPVVVSGSMDLGTLGNAGVFHTRATVGFVHKRLEVYGGYDYLRIGGVNLQGPLVGVRFWF